MLINRRFLLGAGAPALAAASVLPAPAFARDEKKARAGDITVKDVNGLTVFGGSGCNVVALAGPEGALLVDGGRAVNAAVLLSSVSGALKTKRVHTLINTHWHPEQVGCNEAV